MRKEENGRSNKKSKHSSSQYEDHTQTELKLLLTANNATISGLKDEQIKCLEEIEKVRDVGEMNNTQM